MPSFNPPSQHVGETAVDELINALSEDVAVGRHAQRELRQILRGLANDLLTALLAVEPRVVSGAVEGLVGRLVVQGKALVRAKRGEGDDVTIGTCPTRHTRSELDESARRVLIGV